MVIKFQHTCVSLDNIPFSARLRRKSFTLEYPSCWTVGAKIPVGLFPSLVRQIEQLHKSRQGGQAHSGSNNASRASSPYLNH